MLKLNGPGQVTWLNNQQSAKIFFIKKKNTFKLEIESESLKTTVPLVNWSAIDPIVVYNDKYTCMVVTRIYKVYVLSFQINILNIQSIIKLLWIIYDDSIKITYKHTIFKTLTIKQ